MTEVAEVQVDLGQVAAEVDKLTDAEVREKLTAIRTRQRVAQKKYQNPANQKAYQTKVKERNKLLKERAIASGIYDDILKQAEANAEAKLEEEASAAIQD